MDGRYDLVLLDETSLMYVLAILGSSAKRLQVKTHIPLMAPSQVFNYSQNSLFFDVAATLTSTRQQACAAVTAGLHVFTCCCSMSSCRHVLCKGLKNVNAAKARPLLAQGHTLSVQFNEFHRLMFSAKLH